jgi:hypothetical protein
LDYKHWRDDFTASPQELVDAVGWNVGDRLIWEETTFLEDDGEYEGFAIWRKSDEENDF